MSDITTTITVLKDIALAGTERPFAERQRAIDALTLFHEDALRAFEDIAKKTDHKTLKDRAELYSERIKSGMAVSLNL